VRRLSTALAFIFVAAVARGEWKLISAQSEPSLAKGLEHRYVVVEDSTSGDRASLELAIFSTKSVRLRVVDQPDEPRVDLAEAMRRGKYLAGVNGGYFDPDYKPIGLLIVDGKIISPLQRARLLSGVLSAAASKIQIWRFDEFPRQQKFDAAIGCGPMVVDLGKAVRGLEATRGARRTFAAVERGDRAAIGFCSEVSLADLSGILAGGLGDFKIQRALNLDGGSSSAFWFKRKDGSAFSISEQKSVRDFVALVPK
jgi:phosphodiester glycosidase